MTLQSTLSVLIPIAIVDAMLTSSSVAENDYAVYSALTTYAKGDRVISTVTHRIYESLQASNTAHDPTDINNRVGTSPWWLDVGPTNRWAMFDDQVASQTVKAGTLTVVLKPGFFNAFALFGLSGDTIAVTVKDAPGGNVVYTYNGTLEGSAPADYYEYLFDPFRPQTDFLANGIPPYSNAELTVSVTSVSGNAMIGMLSVGDLRPLGATQRGAKAKPKSFSYIGLDKYGKNTIIRGKSSRDLSLTAWVGKAEADTVMSTLTSVLDVPCAWIGVNLPGYSALRVFGLGSGELSYDYPNDVPMNIEVKGLI